MIDVMRRLDNVETNMKLIIWEKDLYKKALEQIGGCGEAYSRANSFRNITKKALGK